MGLMICPECNKQISQYAEICPDCGFPINTFMKENNIYDINNIFVCPVCAKIYYGSENKYHPLFLKCKYCNSVLIQTDEDEKSIFQLSILKSTEEEFKNKSIEIAKKYGNNQFDENEYNKRINEIKSDNTKWLKEYENKQQSQQQNIPKCPTCGSTNISKISTMSRTASIVGFGILSKKIGKQWQCNNPKCKHMW